MDCYRDYIKWMRVCANLKDCDGCPYQSTPDYNFCDSQMKRDAADAIEALLEKLDKEDN